MITSTRSPSSPSPSLFSPPATPVLPSRAASPAPSLQPSDDSARSDSSGCGSGYVSDGEDEFDPIVWPKRRRLETVQASDFSPTSPRVSASPTSSVRQPSAEAAPPAELEAPSVRAAVVAMLRGEASASAQQVLAQERVLELQGIDVQAPLLQAPLLQAPLPVLRALMAAMPAVTEVHLEGVPEPLAVFERLAFAGLPLEQLTRLRFNNSASISASLPGFLAHTPRLTALRHLTLPEISLPQVAGRKRAWDETVRHVRQLWPTHQAQSTTPADAAASAQLRFFASLHHLQRLEELDWSSVTHAALPLDVQHNGALSQLLLRGAWDGFIAGSGLANTPLTRLQLQDCQLTPAAGAFLAAAPFARSLSHLDVSANPSLGGIDLGRFAALTTLDVRGSLGGGTLVLPRANGVTRDGASGPALQRLNLGATPLRGRLAQVDLGALPNLVELNLEGCGLTAQDFATWEVPANNPLQTLVLADNPLGPEGVAALTLLPLPHLATLDLQRVQLDHTGAVALARGGGLRARWPNLERIRLGHLPPGAALHTLQAISELPGGRSLAQFS